jgi:hypothetical protein
VRFTARRLWFGGVICAVKGALSERGEKEDEQKEEENLGSEKHNKTVPKRE